MTSVEERFNKKVRRTKKCWLWLGTPGGVYGKFRLGNRQHYAHRVAYMMWVGELSDNSVVHHTCGNPRCVRPTHLQLVSPVHNVAEMHERHTYLRAIRRLENEVRKLQEQLRRNNNG